MANLTGTERARYVQDMFGRIARRYDLMNRTMTAGQDVRWRQRGHPAGGAARPWAAARPGRRHRRPGARSAAPVARLSASLAADFTLEMMRVGTAPTASAAVPELPGLIGARPMRSRLPLPAETFDAVVSGFLLRNVSDLALGLSEQHRVLKPGGRLVALDTTPPPHNLLEPLIRFHLHTVIPALGRLDHRAGRRLHLPARIHRELSASRSGWRRACWRPVSTRSASTAGCSVPIAIHWGRKPGQSEPMMEKKRRLVVGISGASGVILGIRLLEVLRQTDVETHLVLSPAARTTIAEETDWSVNDVLGLADRSYRFSDIGAAIASGSFRYPGHGGDPLLDQDPVGGRQLLLRRPARRGRRCDLERRPPAGAGGARGAAAPRPPAPDGPGSAGGAVIFPPVPAFYARPQSVDEITDQIVGRVLGRLGIENDLYQRWKEA